MKLILFLLLLLPLDEKKKVRVTCPLDGHKFTAIQVLRTNDWGGVDRDFCRHAYKTRPMENYVWVCPGCFFSGKKADFEKPLEEERKSKLRGKLKPQAKIRKGMKQEAIPGHVKYDLLAQVGTLSGAPAIDIGRAYLGAAWTLREEGAIFLEHFDEWELGIWNLYHLDRLPLELAKKNRTDYDLEVARKVEKRLATGKYKALDLMLREYLLAFLYRKHGELVDALKWIATLEATKGDNSIVDDAVVRMKETIQREQAYLRKAQPHFEKAVASKELNETTRGEIAYVQGEIHRRLGDFEEAGKAYDFALETSPNKALQQLAREQKAALPK